MRCHASAIAGKPGMRMHDLADSRQAEKHRTGKVHPQLPGSKGCGCTIRQMLEKSSNQRQEKCIRNWREVRDADAQSDKCWKDQVI